MRTTVTLPDDLLREAKELAARRCMTLGKLLEEGLRQMLRESESPLIALRTSDARPQPAIDLNENARLLGIMDERG